MVTLTDIQYPTNFSINSRIEFIFSDKSHYVGEIRCFRGYFIDIKDYSNEYIFKRLGIESPKKFVESIVGYSFDGSWPEVETLKDLRKVLDALLSYNTKLAYNTNRIPEDKKVIINDDKEKSPFTLKVRNKRTPLLNFNL